MIERLKRKTGQGINWCKISRTQWENMGGKPKDYRYCQWKNLPTWTKDRKEKTEIGEERRDLFKERLGRNKVLCSSSMELNCQLSTTMQAPRRSLRQRDRSPAICWLLALENRIDSDSSLLPHLICFLARLVDHSCFCFAESLIFGLVMDGTEFKSADIAVGFSEWSL